MNNKNRYIIIILCFFQFEMAQSKEYQQPNHIGNNLFLNMMEQAMEKSLKNTSNQKTKKSITTQKPIKNKYKQIRDVTKCDILAADPSDPNKKATGIAFKKINEREAIKSCKSAIKKSPNKGRFYFQLARALEKDGQMVSAISNYQNAIDRLYILANYDLGMIMSDLKQYKSAINYYKVLANAGHAKSMFNLSTVYYNLGDKPRSDFWIRQAAKNNLPHAKRVLREERVNSILKFF